MNKPLPLLWLCGAIGVGKSSVGWEIYSRLRTSGIKSGYADADQLGLCDPPPEGDPVNQGVKSRNVGAVFKTYQVAGARCLILTGSVHSQEEVDMYKKELPEVSLTLCLLEAEPDVVRRRFLERGWRAELADEAVKQTAELSRADFFDLRVDTTSHSAPEVARMVCARAGNWPSL